MRLLSTLLRIDKFFSLQLSFHYSTSSRIFFRITSWISCFNSAFSHIFFIQPPPLRPSTSPFAIGALYLTALHLIASQDTKFPYLESFGLCWILLPHNRIPYSTWRLTALRSHRSSRPHSNSRLNLLAIMTFRHTTYFKSFDRWVRLSPYCSRHASPTLNLINFTTVWRTHHSSLIGQYIIRQVYCNHHPQYITLPTATR